MDSKRLYNPWCGTVAKIFHLHQEHQEGCLAYQHIYLIYYSLRKFLLLQLNATYHKAFHYVAITVCKILMQFFLLSLALHVSLAGIKKNEGRNYTLITARFAEASRQWASYILMKTALYSHLIFFCFYCNSYIIYQLADIAQLWNLIYKIGLQSEKT